LFYAAPGTAVVDGLIATIAAINALITAVFSMNLRDESKALHYFMLVPVSLITVLVMTMIFAYP
jgi:hypothetical protein